MTDVRSCSTDTVNNSSVHLSSAHNGHLHQHSHDDDDDDDDGECSTSSQQQTTTTTTTTTATDVSDAFDTKNDSVTVLV